MHTSGFRSIFSRDGVSTVLIFGNKNGDGDDSGSGNLVCCVSDCKYADGWRRLDKWGTINR